MEKTVGETNDFFTYTSVVSYPESNPPDYSNFFYHFYIEGDFLPDLLKSSDNIDDKIIEAYYREIDHILSNFKNFKAITLWPLYKINGKKITHPKATFRDLKEELEISKTPLVEKVVARETNKKNVIPPKEEIENTKTPLVKKVETRESNKKHVIPPKEGMLLQYLCAKDDYSMEHSIRVGLYVSDLVDFIHNSGFLGYDDYTYSIKQAAYLHDIGKIYCHDSILHKDATQPLTNIEHYWLNRHSIVGVGLLSNSIGLNFEYMIMPIIMHHMSPSQIVRIIQKFFPDEFVEGTGRKVLLLCAILKICDSLDAMTSSRPYHEKMSIEKAIEILIKDITKSDNASNVRCLFPIPFVEGSVFKEIIFDWFCKREHSIINIKNTFPHP